MPSKNNNKLNWDGNFRTYPLPPAFKCAVGGEWRPILRFSKNQLAIWHKRKRSPNDGITPANIKLVCRDHTGEPVLSLKCNGPCGLHKARDKFSTAQRRNKFRWCGSCVRWRAQQEYDSVPIAAPNEVNDAPDEVEGFMAQQDDQDDQQGDQPEVQGGERDGQHDEFADIPSLADGEDLLLTDNENDDSPETSVAGYGHYFCDESSEYSDDDDHITTANCAPADDIAKPMSTMIINTNRSLRVPSVNLISGSTQASQQSSRFTSTSVSQGAGTRHALASTQISTFDVQGSSEAHSTQTSKSSWMPLHLLANENQVTLRERNLIQRHVSGPVESGASTPSMVSSDSRAGIPTMSTDSRVPSSEVQGPRALRAQKFTAFDPNGNAHQRDVGGTSTGTNASAAHAAGSVTDRNKPQKGNGNWARVDRRKVFHSLWVPENRSGNGYVDTYNSGSEDEM
ncbi:hypothetical protein TruAng_009528 [Truncatella angustata]|nr:hypothetical protein TruAng_009528 [Truncatella angustata]